MQYLSAEDQQLIDHARRAALDNAETEFNKIDINGDGEVDKYEVEKLANLGLGLPVDADQATK